LPIWAIIPVFVDHADDLGTRRNDHTVAQNADAVRRDDIFTLVIHLLVISLPVAVGVLQDQDPIAFGAFSVVPAIVDDFTDPHAAAVVDIDVRRAQQHRLG